MSVSTVDDIDKAMGETPDFGFKKQAIRLTTFNELKVAHTSSV